MSVYPENRDQDEADAFERGRIAGRLEGLEEAAEYIERVFDQPTMAAEIRALAKPGAASEEDPKKALVQP